MSKLIPVDKKDEIIANVRTFNDYRKSTNEAKRTFFEKKLPNGVHYICLRSGRKVLFCPSRFVGYKNNNSKKHEASYRHGGVTDRAINTILGNHSDRAELEAAFLSFCRLCGVRPSKKTREYWLIDDTQRPSKAKESSYSKKANSTGYYEEGTSSYRSQNSYERNPKARNECIKLYGRDCSVCCINFESVYGDIGKTFIHVHHLTPLKQRGGKAYKVDPETDLRPVCPNCHAMLHQQEPPLTIKALQKRMSTQ